MAITTAPRSDPPSTLSPPGNLAPPRELRSETAVALLDAAEDLFSRRGYEAVGIRDIAERAKANIASIKYHFGSKRDLYRATIRESMTRREEGGPWNVLDPPPASRREACAVVARFTSEFIHEALGDRPPRSCAMLMTREAMQPSEAFDDIVHDYILPRMKLLELTVGLIRPDADATARSDLATSVLSQILYFVVFRSFAERIPNLRLDDPDAVQRVADSAARFALRGLEVTETDIDNAIGEATSTREQ